MIVLSDNSLLVDNPRTASTFMQNLLVKIRRHVTNSEYDQPLPKNCFNNDIFNYVPLRGPFGKRPGGSFSKHIIPDEVLAWDSQVGDDISNLHIRDPTFKKSMCNKWQIAHDDVISSIKENRAEFRIFVRHPVDRLFSQYLFSRQPKRKKLFSFTKRVTNFCEWAKENLHAYHELHKLCYDGPGHELTFNHEQIEFKWLSACEIIENGKTRLGTKRKTGVKYVCFYPWQLRPQVEYIKCQGELSSNVTCYDFHQFEKSVEKFVNDIKYFTPKLSHAQEISPSDDIDYQLVHEESIRKKIKNLVTFKINGLYPPPGVDSNYKKNEIEKFLKDSHVVSLFENLYKQDLDYFNFTVDEVFEYCDI